MDYLISELVPGQHLVSEDGREWIVDDDGKMVQTK